MINEALSLGCQGAQVSYSSLFSQVTQQRKRLLRLQERVDSFDRQLEFLRRQRVSDLVASGGKGILHRLQTDHPCCRLSIHLKYCTRLGDIWAYFKPPPSPCGSFCLNFSSGTSVGAGDECFVDQVMAELEKARNDRSEMQGKLDKFEVENDRLKELLGYALSELEQANHIEKPVSAIFETCSSQEQTQMGESNVLSVKSQNSDSISPSSPPGDAPASRQ